MERPRLTVPLALLFSACGADESIDLERWSEAPDAVRGASSADLGPDLITAASPDVSRTDASAAEDPARTAYEAEIAPRLARCLTCHEDPPLHLLAPPDRLASLLAYRDGALFDCDAPARSALVTKGAHAGAAAFSPADEAAIVAWIAGRCAPAEVPRDAGPQSDAAPDAAPDARPPAGQAIVGPAFLAVQNENTWDLSDLAPGITGARLTFTATFVGGGLHLEGLSLRAGPAGLRARVPALEACRFGEARRPPEATFSGPELVLAPGAQASLGAGTLTLPGLEPGMPLAVRFEALGPAEGPFGPAEDRGGACGQ